ncbi:unnamed protein product [Rotaria sp. Silwood2]|nr:unnamed protein product [Rotaria sp. Silwood2]
MAHLIDPKNVISLTLSDEQRTFGQIRLFLRYFLIDQFSQLRSLTLIYIREEDLNEFQKYIMKCSLTTVSISFSDSNSKNMKQLLTSILSRKSLRKLKLGDGDDIITDMRWPIRCKLENMTISGKCNWDIIYFIISHSPHLRKLVLERFSLDENITIESDMKQCDHLTSLSLYISYEITMNDLELFLIFLRKLTYLQLFGPGYRADPSLFDGCR